MQSSNLAADAEDRDHGPAWSAAAASRRTGPSVAVDPVFTTTPITAGAQSRPQGLQGVYGMRTRRMGDTTGVDARSHVIRHHRVLELTTHLDPGEGLTSIISRPCRRRRAGADG